jgi:hypothetical protein
MSMCLIATMLTFPCVMNSNIKIESFDHRQHICLIFSSTGVQVLNIFEVTFSTTYIDVIIIITTTTTIINLFIKFEIPVLP